MIKFWVDRENCFYQNPDLEKYYSSLPFNKISTDGMIDLSFGMGFDIMDELRDVVVTIYILDKGFKI